MGISPATWPQGGTLTLRTAPAILANGKPAIRIEVADTGVGIAAENLTKIMEPFFTTKEEGKGTGLGLAICRRVVQEHHGTIPIESEVGKGTTVRIMLPVKNGTNVDRLRSAGSVDWKRKTAEMALQQAKGNKVYAAKLLGITRRALYRLITKYGLEEI